MMKELSCKQQVISVCLSIVFCFEVIASIYFLFQLAETNGSKSISSGILFKVICSSGFFGGATRALNMLIINLNHESDEMISGRLSRWFLYLIKPFVGIGGGFAFFTVTNIGLLSGMRADKAGFDFYAVLLTSFTGGMFFEDAFKKLYYIVKGMNVPGNKNRTQSSTNC